MAIMHLLKIVKAGKKRGGKEAAKETESLVCNMALLEVCKRQGKKRGGIEDGNLAAVCIY
jgi:hypothetical protein